MFENEELKNHLETSFSISSEAFVTAEWNLNVPGNIAKLGNYRYRSDTTNLNALPNIFDPSDSDNFYTGATDADVVIESGFEEDGETPLAFTYKKEKEKLYYSLEDCIKPFRPRSGINKLSYFSDRYLPSPNVDMFNRPRYYMSSRDDFFKYWRSYRTENGEEYGISKNSAVGVFEIDDAVPFVVYKEVVPSNKIVLKVQTNIGSVDRGTFSSGDESFEDPFFGESNKTTPQRFAIQYLNENDQWVEAISFNENSTRPDGSPIFGSDGTLEIEYGLITPEEFINNFYFQGNIVAESGLPTSPPTGTAYLLISSETDQGTLKIYNGSEYVSASAQYGWQVANVGNAILNNYLKDTVNPAQFENTSTSQIDYRELQYLKGLRIWVESMNRADTPLELIEMSPRLQVDFSDRVIDFNIEKTLSDLTDSALPVGNLTSSTGSLKIFDEEQAFNENNSQSIISKYLSKNIKFNFYETINNVNDFSYSVPIKTLYSEGFPQVDKLSATVSIPLKDFYFYLESNQAPRILITEVSLSQAVCILLDSIGFSNYVFFRNEDEPDPVIPYFFVPSEKNVAEVLSDLAKATQSAMFFDEYNNFVVMTKEYLLDESTREVNMVMYGDTVVAQNGIEESVYSGKLANIKGISSEDQNVYNDGAIDYTTRYIQRSYASLKQAQYVDKTWIYKPSLLWEVSGTEKTTSANQESQNAYVLGALPLNDNIPAEVPSVQNNEIVNNIIDVGENAYWTTRYEGFLYANGEIIKYDAVQFNVSGTGDVWISSNLDYQRYFASLPFNGKIYPTGLIRIYAKPYVEKVDGITRLRNGEVAEHGRGQFGTNIVEHTFGLSDYWSSPDNVRGCEMDSELLFTSEIEPDLPETFLAEAGVSNNLAKKSQRNGLIRNFLSTKYSSETTALDTKTANAGSLQSSALVMTGPDFPASDTPRDFLTYVHKPIDGAFTHFGTRIRLVGQVEALGDRSQTPTGSMTYFNLPTTDPTQTVTIGGGSGGISVVNPDTNVGYYFEIAALTSDNLQAFLQENQEGEATVSLNNILLYKIKADEDSNAIPERMWGGIGEITVDSGDFVGQYRFAGDENPTVYDLAIDYVDVTDNLRKIYLYINQKLVQIVDDTDPLPLVTPSIGLFVRGTSKAMFENVYALSQNYSENAVFDTNVPIASVFSDDRQGVNATDALSKYAMSGIIQQTYLSNINSIASKDYQIFYEEFGTIMRECAYFNIKYDRAYPALYAKIAPTFNRLKGYTVSGFRADSYGAEFLIFNNTDTLLNLDETTGNYLRILGVAFTQDTTQKLTVDDYYKKVGSITRDLESENTIRSSLIAQQEFDEIKNSRLIYGRNEFTLSSDYIQDQDTAEDILGWMIKKKLRPRKAVGLDVFSLPILQLGDIINIDYKNNDGVDVVAPNTTRFVVYNITYRKQPTGPSMQVFVSEV